MNAATRPPFGRLRDSLTKPVLGSFLVVFVCFAVSYFFSDANKLFKEAYVVAIYGASIFISVLILRWATTRGSYDPHVFFLSLIWLSGLGIMYLLHPENLDPGKKVDELLPDLLMKVMSFDLKAALKSNFTGVWSDSAGYVFALLNALAMILISFAILIWRLCVFNTFPSLNPSLNNETVSRSLGAFAVVMTSVMMVWAWLDLQGDDNSAWVKFAKGFPWYAMVLPVLYLSVLSLRRKGTTVSSANVNVLLVAGKGSVKPIYEALLTDQDLKPFIRHHALEPASKNSPNPGNVTSKYINELEQKKFLVFLGSATLSFYKVFAGAVQKAQDRGRSVLVLCPDKTGADVKATLSQSWRLLSPELLHRNCDLFGDNPDFSGQKYYDVIIAEERWFHDKLVAQRSEFMQTLHRVDLITLIDFHEIDASRLQRAMANLQSEGGLPQDINVLALSSDHTELKNQLDGVFGRQNHSRSEGEFLSPAAVPETYRVFWEDGPDLRKALMKKLNLANGRLEDASTLLTVLGAGDDYPAQLMLDYMDRLAGSDLRMSAFVQRLASQNLVQESARAKAVQQRHHTMGMDNRRVIIVNDWGNLSDAISRRHNFAEGPEDRLIHIVVKPYAARAFALDRTGQVPNLTRPSSQLPGTGIMETAENVYDLMQQSESGASEKSLADVLNQSSGKIAPSLQLYPTRRGLTELFRIVLQENRANLVQVIVSDDNQQQSFLARGLGMGGTARRAKVHKRGGVTEPLGTISLFDEGLLYCETGGLWLKGSHYGVENIDRTQHRINVALLDKSHFSRYVFQRQYNVQLEDKFVVERAIMEKVKETQVSRAFVYANVTRKSTAYVELPASIGFDDVNPELEVRGVSTDCNVVRPFPAAYIIAIRSSDTEHDTKFRDGMVGAALAASLQDVIGLLFPLLSHRLAVGAEGTEHRQSGTYPYLQYQYPVISAGGTSVFEKAMEHALKSVGSNSSVGGTAVGNAGINLLVIEDADSDLGVVRKLFTSWDDVLKHWKTYLEWAKDKPMWQAERQIFDAKSAFEIVLRMSGE